MIILLLGFSIFQFYSASVVGTLLMQKPKTIKTLRNLIDSSLKTGIEDIVYNKDFFKVSFLPHTFPSFAPLLSRQLHFHFVFFSFLSFAFLSQSLHSSFMFCMQHKTPTHTIADDRKQKENCH